MRSRSAVARLVGLRSRFGGLVSLMSEILDSKFNRDLGIFRIPGRSLLLACHRRQLHPRIYNCVECTRLHYVSRAVIILRGTGVGVGRR